MEQEQGTQGSSCGFRVQGHRLPIANVFVRKMGCNVLALSYRGCVRGFLEVAEGGS